MKTMPVTLEQGRATCNDPQHLPLVDAAFAKPGGPAAQEMKRTLCRECPVAEHCLAWGMTHAEAGIWGGLSPRVRGDHGAPRGITPVEHARTEGVPAQAWRRKTPAAKQAEQPRRQCKPSAAATLCAQLGVREADVKRWAHEQGLTTTISGRASLAHVEAWATAHKAA